MNSPKVQVTIMLLGLSLIVISIFNKEYIYPFLASQLVIGIIHIFSSMMLHMEMRYLKSFKHLVQNYWIAVLAYFSMNAFILGTLEFSHYEITVPIIWFIIIPWMLGFYYVSITCMYRDYIKSKSH